MLAKSVLHIENSAFHGCAELEEIELMDVKNFGAADCQNIAEDAFDGCSEELVIIASTGSYGEAYTKNKSFAKEEPSLLDKILFWRKE